MEITLNNQVKMPILPLGTYPMKGEELSEAINYAYHVGYRHFDMARAYFNELDFREAINKYKIPRENLFITSKFNVSKEIPNIKGEINKSLKALQTDYIDMYLMHWPHPKNFLEAWKQLEEIYYTGKVKAIGVCNFRKKHLELLLQVADVVPVVNQIEVHPLFVLDEEIDFCKQKNILVESYCPLALMNEKLFQSDVLQKIAKKYNKTVAQIVLRWNIERGLVPVPKASKKKHIQENLHVFDFSLQQDEVIQINQLNIMEKMYSEKKYCEEYWRYIG